MLLVETVRKSGLDTAISAALVPWRKPRTVHDPVKILLDVALAVALGGNCLADVGILRAEPAVFGPLASNPTAGGQRVLAALRTARAEVREHVWRLAGYAAPNAGGQVIVDIDGVLVLAHSEKQDATATWKKTFGHHPLRGLSTTAAADPASRSWTCSGPATRTPTPPRTTSRPPCWPWPSCRSGSGAAGRH